MRGDGGGADEARRHRDVIPGPLHAHWPRRHPAGGHGRAHGRNPNLRGGHATPSARLDELYLYIFRAILLCADTGARAKAWCLLIHVDVSHSLYLSLTGDRAKAWCRLIHEKASLSSYLALAL